MKKVFLTLVLIVFASANAVTLEEKSTLKPLRIDDCEQVAEDLSGTDDHYDADWQYWHARCAEMN